MNDLYRDPLVHVHARIAELRARATELSRRLAAAAHFWEHHPQERASVAELSARLGEAPPAPGLASDAYLEQEHVLSSLVSTLEELALRIPAHEAELAQIPHGHPPAQPHVPKVGVSLLLGDKTSEVEWLMEKLTRTMRSIDEKASVRGEGALEDARIVKVTFTSAGVPFTYTGALIARTAQYPVLGSHFATYVRRDAAPLEVRPQGMLTGLFRVLHLTAPVRTGDLDFDGLFAISATGDAVTPPRVLTELTRGAMLEISRCDVPTLLVEPGIARLFFTFELTTPTFEPLVRAALRCLREVRRMAAPAPPR